jgi:hypothetical protein
VGLYRENYYDRDGSDQLEVIIRANREGNMGTVYLNFDKGSESYHDMAAKLPVYPITPQPQPPAQPALVDIQDERKDIYQ